MKTNRQIYFFNNNELTEIEKIKELVWSIDRESVKLGMGLFLETFGKYYVSSNKQRWDISTQLRNKHGVVLLYDIMQLITLVLSRKYLYYE